MTPKGWPISPNELGSWYWNVTFKMGHTDHWHDLQNLPAKPGTTVMHRKGQMVNHLQSQKLPLVLTCFPSATLQVAPSLPEDLSRRWPCFIFPFVPWSFSLQIICKQAGHITVTFGQLTHHFSPVTSEVSRSTWIWGSWIQTPSAMATMHPRCFPYA